VLKKKALAHEQEGRRAEASHGRGVRAKSTNVQSRAALARHGAQLKRAGASPKVEFTEPTPPRSKAFGSSKFASSKTGLQVDSHATVEHVGWKREGKRLIRASPKVGQGSNSKWFRECKKVQKAVPKALVPQPLPPLKRPVRAVAQPNPSMVIRPQRKAESASDGPCAERRKKRLKLTGADVIYVC